jgi:[ribosomal protein S18]-alanine N-acetyltransferase
MHIRPATSNDIPAMLAIEKASPEASHWSLNTYQQIFTGTAVRLALIVVDEDDDVAGFLVARLVPGEWELENIVIASHNRRCGYGSLLLEQLLYRARLESPTKISLEVRESNAPARSLYEQFSFRQLSTRSGYYEHPKEDAIVYALSI